MSVTFAKDFLSAIKELDAPEEAVGSAPWFEMEQICNPTPCVPFTVKNAKISHADSFFETLGLKCKDKDKW